MAIDERLNPFNLAPTQWGEPLPPGRGVSPSWRSCYEGLNKFRFSHIQGLYILQAGEFLWQFV